MKNTLKILVIVMALVSLLTGCSDKKVEELVIFHAGSLAIPLKDMSDAFCRKHPCLNIMREASGSVTAARKISDLHREADIMASADYTVIENILMPKYTDYFAKFATNEMVIMYSDKSRFAGEINGENWPDVLLREGVEYGHSDPNTDPCGYRSQLVWQLAEKFYKKPGLYEELREKRPEKNIRPKETDLLALLETGEIDYIFIYRSVAEQHKGRYVILPDRINLKSAKYADFYRQATIDIAGKKPGETVTKRGEPMVYGITTIRGSKNHDNAMKFMEFVLSPEGQAVMARNGQPPIAPAEGAGEVPKALKGLVRR
jgi:molybdate/tungstate transport system substrate-binding protein